jgi:hypothetical protein
MSASFSVVGRAQLAGYAGTASGILRSRIHPLVPIAAIDVLAVAVALGAMNLVGTIVGGHRENPFLAAIDRTKDDFTTFAVRAPMPAPVVAQTAPTVAEVFAAVPDSELLFAPPVFIGGPFEDGQGDTVRFISPVDVAATNANEPTTAASGPATGEEPQPTDVAVVEEPLLPDPAVTDDDPQSPSVAKILSIAGRTQTRALELADQAVVTPVEKVVTAGASVDLGGAGAAVTSTASAAGPIVTNAASSVVAPVVQAAAAPVQAVTAPVQSIAAPVVQSAAAPVRQVVQSVTQPVTQVVGGLLN